MKDILVVAKLADGKFEKFMGFMKSEEGMNERRKIADLTKTLGLICTAELETTHSFLLNVRSNGLVKGSVRIMSLSCLKVLQMFAGRRVKISSTHSLALFLGGIRHGTL